MTDAAKKCPLTLAFIKDVIASGRDDVYNYVLDWFAWKVRNPLEKPGTNLVLIGGQGTGKSTLGKMLCDIFGPDYAIHVTHESHLLGRFNGHQEGKLVMFADEAIFGRNPAVAGVYKGLTTEETMLIERKGVDARRVRNRLAIIVASNTLSAVPVEPGDRRATVLEVSSARKEDSAYFAALWGEWRNGGREAFIELLRGRDLTQFDPRKPLPTREKALMAGATGDPVTRFWLDLLAAGNPPHELVPTGPAPDWSAGPVSITNKDMVGEFLLWARSNQVRHLPSRDEIIKEIGQLCPSRRKHRPSINGRQEWAYEYPALDACRDAAQIALGGRSDRAA